MKPATIMQILDAIEKRTALIYLETRHTPYERGKQWRFFPERIGTFTEYTGMRVQGPYLSGNPICMAPLDDVFASQEDADKFDKQRLLAAAEEIRQLALSIQTDENES